MTFGIGVGCPHLRALRAPFLFPGNFKLFEELQDEGGLEEYDLDR